MPYCSQCGVELDAKVHACPLCRAPVQAAAHSAGALPEYAPFDYPEEHLKLPAAYGRRFAVYLLSLIFVTPVLIVLVVNLVYGRGLNWSLYVAASLFTVWAYSVIPLLLYGRAGSMVAAYVGVSALFLWVIDRLHGEPFWFRSLGLPVVAVVTLVCSAVVLASVRVKSKGANIAAFVLLGLAALCVGIDVVIALNLNGAPRVGWSAIVTVAVIPTAAFLLYLQYGVARRIDFRRHFHV